VLRGLHFQHTPPQGKLVGVTRGRIFVGDFGPAYRRTYTVTGDSVNLAARLMARAAPGQILVASDVVERSRTRFDVTALEPFTVKGKREPVHAFTLGRALGTAAVETERAPLVGRENELAALLAGLESLRAGSSSLVDLVGEPGLGKSRLIEELRTRAGEIRTLSVESDEYGSSKAYGVFRSLLHDLLGLTDDAHPPETERALRTYVEAAAPHLAQWLPLLGTPLGLDIEDTPETELLDERFRRERVHEVTAELLGMLLLEPALLVFEDAHWMDDASAELLRHLITQLELRPWMVVVTRRDQETGFVTPEASSKVRIDLLPLGPEHASALLHATTEEMPLLPHELEALAERSGGNPLFLAELLAAARQAGGIESLPDSVESLLMAQIDRLSPADRRLLRSAAVIGAVFSPDLLGEALEKPVDGDAWVRLADFLHDQGDGHFRFRHALVRDAAYEGLSFRRRRELHSAVGLTIERSARGRGEDNAELGRRLLLGERLERPPTPFQRKLYLSAFQSLLFNRALAGRIRAGTLGRALVGDVLRKSDTGGLFVCAEPALDQPRVDAFEVSPAGPLFGPKMLKAGGAVAAAEETLLEDGGVTLEDFRRGRGETEGGRRAYRVRLEGAAIEEEGRDVLLSFTLPRGSYATVVLEEVMKPGAGS
jgi:hypothetical protein